MILYSLAQIKISPIVMIIDIFCFFVCLFFFNLLFHFGCCAKIVEGNTNHFFI